MSNQVNGEQPIERDTRSSVLLATAPSDGHVETVIMEQEPQVNSLGARLELSACFHASLPWLLLTHPFQAYCLSFRTIPSYPETPLYILSMPNKVPE